MPLKIVIILIISNLVCSKLINYTDRENIEEYISIIKSNIGTEKQFVARNKFDYSHIYNSQLQFQAVSAYLLNQILNVLSISETENTKSNYYLPVALVSLTAVVFVVVYFVINSVLIYPFERKVEYANETQV